MGERGPAPKPTALKLLDGTANDRINHREPKIEGEVTPPTGLSAGARRVWKSLAPKLVLAGVLQASDAELFGAYCTAVDAQTIARRTLNREGYTCEGAHGGTVTHPSWRIWREATDTMTKIGGRFGLTPSDRSRIVVDTPAPTKTAKRLLG